MGIEYYLVKPEKKEVFYLGKHFTCPYGIANRAYKNKACFIDQDCFDDFLWDFLRDNSEYFNDLKLEDIKEAIYKVYEWCSDGKIYFDHDCNDDREWVDWKETGSLDTSDIITPEENKGLSEELEAYLEIAQASIFVNPDFNEAIIGITTDDRAVYDYDLMVESLAKKDNISLDEAQEFIDYNTVRTLPYMPNAPVIIMKQ